MWQKSSVEEQESTDTRRGLGETSVTLVSSALFFLQCKKTNSCTQMFFNLMFSLLNKKLFTL